MFTTRSTMPPNQLTNHRKISQLIFKWIFLSLEHLLRHLSEYDIDYPTETTHNGRYIRHVSSSDHGRRRRRSLQIHEGPVYYQVRYRGKKYHMRLKLNENLFGKNFTIERHKKGGRVEITNFIEHCYLIGETTLSNHSAAISDCDGLVSTNLIRYCTCVITIVSV